MKERPILFSAPMARAILDGRKSHTRRVVKPQPDAGAGLVWARSISGEWGPFTMYHYREERTGWIPRDDLSSLRCPYGQPGDRLWVRETVWIPRTTTALDWREGADTWPKCIYSADTDCAEIEWMREMRWKQRPSIHMPRWASRITLEITDVRIQRAYEAATK